MELDAMRVCILAQASPCTWVSYYIAAFRRCCDARVIGPAPSVEDLAGWGRTGAEDLVPRLDAACDFETFQGDLVDLLPAGWRPDLVVGISGVGGAPLYARVAELECPTAFISTDTWQCLLDYREAVQYDVVFAAQREFLPHLEATGSRHVFWLPLACDPEAHHPAGGPPEYDIAFAGSATQPIHATRRMLLESLSQRFSVLARESVFGEAACGWFGRGRLSFNHAAVRELNMRIFEVMAMGRPLLTNVESVENGLLDLFEAGRHLIVYDSVEDLFAKVRCYLSDDAGRCAVAEAGRAEVLAKHTYDHRVRTLIERVWALAPHALKGGIIGRSGKTPAGDCLPTLPGETVDLGLTLGVSRVALRHRGVTRFVGVPGNLDAAHYRRNSYDALEPLIALPDACADTVITALPNGLGLPVEEILWQAHRLLRAGGTLVLRCDPAVMEALLLKPEPAVLGPWLEQRDFHLRRFFRRGGEGYAVQARKRTRRLAGVVREVFERIEAPGVDMADLLRRIPPGW